MLEQNVWMEACDPFLSPVKEAPGKIHPQGFNLSKLTFQHPTQKSGQNSHIAPLQGHLAD